MAAKRRKPPARPAKPRGGGRVSGTVNVAPKLTIFGGGLLSFNFGGGGKGRGRGKGGLIKRVAGLVGKGLQEMRSPTAGKISPGEKGRSLDDFRAERPDLFEGPQEFDITVDSDVDDDDQADEDDQGDDQGARGGAR